MIARKSLEAKISPTASGFTAVITAETIDRDGEVLIPAGMNSKTFDTNPILFWNHDYSMPVGRATALKRRDRDIVGEFVFAKRPEGHTGDFFPDVAAALVGQGIVRGVSVGYEPEPGGIRKALDADRKKYGDRVHTIFNRWKLLEVSLAPMQANPDALITAIKKGMISPGAAKRYFGIAAPARTVIQVRIPVAAASTKGATKPIHVDEIVEREIARRKGSIYG